MNTAHANHTKETGAIQLSTVVISILAVLFAVAGSLAIWSYVQYSEQKTDVDGKIDLAVSKAEKVQAELDEVKFAEREKEPNRQFVGPTDYGRVSFSYPKTWSVYVAQDGKKSNKYEAYMNPIVVPTVSGKQKFALRVLIEEKDVSRVLDQYSGLIKKGDLKSSAFNAKGVGGTRFDGLFKNDMRGSAVIFKIRDKTLTIQTDANTFRPDFDKLIKTIEFNQ